MSISFRKHWSIDFYGKWTESEYQSSVYPTFACGSGYVISADIAAWLSANKAILHRYQVN
jgi:UDP-galNAc:beta-1,3-N-acetylgalactosaminyltransferase 2